MLKYCKVPDKNAGDILRGVFLKLLCIYYTKSRGTPNDANPSPGLGNAGVNHEGPYHADVCRPSLTLCPLIPYNRKPTD
jgi:hypothetical protein